MMSMGRFLNFFDDYKICLFCIFLGKHNDSPHPGCFLAQTPVLGGTDIASFAMLGNSALATCLPGMRQMMQLELMPPCIPLTWILHPSVQQLLMEIVHSYSHRTLKMRPAGLV